MFWLGPQCIWTHARRTMKFVYKIETSSVRKQSPFVTYGTRYLLFYIILSILHQTPYASQNEAFYSSLLCTVFYLDLSHTNFEQRDLHFSEIILQTVNTFIFNILA